MNMKKITVITLTLILVLSLATKIYAEDDNLEHEDRYRQSSLDGQAGNHLSQRNEFEEDDDGGPVRVGVKKLPTLTPVTPTAVPTVSSGITGSSNTTVTSDPTPTATPAPSITPATTQSPEDNSFFSKQIKKLIDDFKSFINIFIKFKEN